MLRSMVIGGCLIATLAACVTDNSQSRKHSPVTAANTALTGACLAADLPPCEIAASSDAKAQAAESKAARTRAEAQRSSDAATKAAVQRSSCLSDTGPRLPVSQDQCATYGRSYSGKELQQTGEVNAGEALRMLDPSVSIQH
jgi:hypothetical protein